jgi:hypothetical protein
MAPNPPFVVGENPTAAKLNTGVYVYDQSPSAVDVVSTATETTVYSKVIGAGHMSSDRTLHCTITAEYLNNTGANRDLTVRIKFGGTTHFGHVGTFVSDPDRYSFPIAFSIQNLGAANVNFLQGWWGISGSPAAGSVAGVVQSGSPSWFMSNGNMTIDTALAQTLEVTVQHSVSSASLSFRKKYANLEMVG